MGEINRISTLFNKYAAGKADQEEVAELLGMIKSENSTEELDAGMEDLWNQMKDAPEQHDVDWDRIYTKTVTSGSARSAFTIKRTAWLSAAAMLLGLFSFAAWFIVKQGTVKEDLQYVSESAGAGTTRIIYLNDGSKVTLNAGTVLRYPKKFTGVKREVYLNGEAYFEIAHHPEKSFLVHSGKVITSVLGTSFNVAAYEKISSLSVTVVSGKVAVKNITNNQLVMLKPKQRVSLSNLNKQFMVDTVKDADDMIAWRKGELIFNNATLEEIAYRIGFKYNEHIEITNKEKSLKKITGTFNKQSFPEIMNAITRLTGTKYSETDQNYTIY